MAIGVFGVVANETDRARSRPQSMWVFSVDVTKTCDGVVSYIAQWFFSPFGALDSLAFSWTRFLPASDSTWNLVFGAFFHVSDVGSIP